MFRPDEKLIFKFHNGNKIVLTDPIEIDLNLEDKNPHWRELFQAAQANNVEAVREIVQLARSMFGLPEATYDEATDKISGLTSVGVVGILTDYIYFMEGLKKNIEEPLTSTPSMDAPLI